MFEKVNPSHPDKMADRIAGAMVDLAYEKQTDPKIAVEVLIGHGVCHIIAETSVHISAEEAESIVRRIAGNLQTDYSEVPQDAHLAENQSGKIRCGDNGIFKGMPVTDEQCILTAVADKVRCGVCGQNYVRRKFRNSTEEYYSWLCRSHFKNKTENACEGRAVRQSVLEDGFETATGINFSEEVFAEMVEVILISGDEELTYRFKDGTEKKVYWERSNRSRPPLKRKKAEQKEQKHFFTGKVICGCCGKPMRRIQSYSVNNDAVARWKCQDAAECGTHFIYEDTLMETLSHVLWLTDFDEVIYQEKVGSIEISGKGLLRITMKSAETVTVRFETRQRRSKRDEEGNSDSGHEEQVH